jgi:hypothetical protein
VCAVFSLFVAHGANPVPQSSYGEHQHGAYAETQQRQVPVQVDQDASETNELDHCCGGRQQIVRQVGLHLAAVSRDGRDHVSRLGLLDGPHGQPNRVREEPHPKRLRYSLSDTAEDVGLGTREGSNRNRRDDESSKEHRQEICASSRNRHVHDGLHEQRLDKAEDRTSE